MATKRGLSRRDFLRAGAGGLVGMMGLSLLAACQPQAPAPPAQPTKQKFRSVKVTSGGFKDWFAPHDAHVYRFPL